VIPHIQNKNFICPNDLVLRIQNVKVEGKILFFLKISKIRVILIKLCACLKDIKMIIWTIRQVRKVDFIESIIFNGIVELFVV